MTFLMILLQIIGILFLISLGIGLISVFLRLIKDLIVYFYYKMRYKTAMPMLKTHIHKLMVFFMVENKRPPTSSEIKTLLKKYENKEITEEQLEEIEEKYKELIKGLDNNLMENLKERVKKWKE